MLEQREQRSKVTQFDRNGERPLRGRPPDAVRTPPHSDEAEWGVLGSMLVNPRDICSEMIGSEMFYNPMNRTIYLVLVEMFNQRKAIDLITVTNELRDRNLLDSCGGAVYVTNLFTFVPTAANIRYYAEIVRDKYLLREVITGCTENVRVAYEEGMEIADVLEQALKH